MKKIVGFTICLILLLSTIAFAGSPSYTTYRRTGDGIAVGMPCYITKIRFLWATAESNDATVIIYDNATAASGRVIAQYDIDVSEELTNLKAEMFQDTAARNGVFVDITTSGTFYWWIEYRRRR